MENYKNKSDILQKILIGIMILLFLIFLICPLIAVFSQVFFNDYGKFTGFENFKTYFASPALLNSAGHSILISVSTAFISVILAFLSAYAITKTNIKFKRFFRYLSMLPLFVPTMVHAMALIYLFGKTGLFTKLGLNVDIYGFKGILAAEVIYTFPQALMILIVALSNTDNRMYEASEVMGASPLKTFFKITLPGIKYGIISALTVCFTLSFTDFGGPQVLGGSYNVLATDIYKQVIGQQNMAMGAVIGVVLTIPAIGAFIIDSISKKKAARNEITSKAVPYIIKKNKKRDMLFGTYMLLTALCIIIFFGGVIIAAFTKRWPYDFTFTLEHFNFNDRIVNGGSNSFYISIKIALLTTIIGTFSVFICAYAAEKIKVFKFLRKVLDMFSMLPMALPGLVIGLSYIMFFNNPSNPLSFLYRTLIIMVAANVVHMFSVTSVTAKTALKKLDREYENIADSLSIPFYRLFFKVTVPMCIEAILEIAVYFFVNTMVTVSAVVFLYTAENKPASITILNMDDNGDYAAAAALSVLVLAVNIFVRTIYEVITNKTLNKLLKWRNPEKNKAKFRKPGIFKNEKLSKKVKITSAALAAVLFIIFAGKSIFVKKYDTGNNSYNSEKIVSESAESGEINVYTALEDDVINNYLADFKEKYPHIKVNIIRDSTGVIVSKIIAEKDNPVADVIWGTAVTSFLDLEKYNLIEPYTPKGAEHLLPQFKDKEEPLRWAGIDVPEAAMLVNTEECRKRNISVPESYEDLIKPEYKGLITMPDPTASGTGLLIVNGILQIMGNEEGWAYLDKLNENIISYQASGSKPAKMAASGECVIGLSMGYRCVSLQNEGNPAKAVFPKEGAGWDVEANCLIRKENIKPAAKTFLDWAVSEEAMQAYGKEFPITAVGGDGTIPEGYEKIPVENLSDKIDVYECAENRQKIFDEFTKRYLSGK